mmetsp:Transcript_17918/g.27998  ORF Transcript_17918/g.27998 Transcript_17918/m.27998 type:complete len:355 (-) Transcript_17918:390-1454(-)|eukprot:CAMPEP_0201606170 /NCGR_PEP_ID=MMETSP0492-20130828/5723_1 /ASSEMBLY_ACC=CAM_ASM_000837 /TAXON_ID=420259 /ORGANISM="Thalassiosira gravida, Strain GMp14c1" /LENGTH=354 /DNA_ID=CAMNT_0048070529 /DNA_START=33 /DNA_END=1097 /DNA_ORIENTATION=+
MAYTSLAALIILSALATSAFVQIGSAPQRTAQLHATEAFQRSLLTAQLGGGSSTAAAAPTAPDTSSDVIDDQEKFHRSLLEAKLVYDATSLASAPVVTELEPAPPVVVEEEESPVVVAVAEPEPEPEPAAPEPVVAASIPKPKPKIAAPKLSVPEPASLEVPTQPTPTRVVRELAIVPINEASVEFTAGTIGAAAGFVLGGPIVAGLVALSCNYLARKDDDKSSSTTTTTTSPKKVVDTASITALNAYNSLAKFEKQNAILDTISNLLENIVNKAKESDSPAGDAIVAVESTLGGIVDKVEEYDLVGGAGTVLDSVGDLVEIGVDKVVDLNEEYRFTERVGGVVKGAVKTVTEN